MRRWIASGAMAAALLLSVSMASGVSAGSGGAARAVVPAGISSPQVARLGAYTEVTMELDSHGHIDAVAAGNSGLWYITNASGSFTRKRITSVVSRSDSHGHDGQPSLALDSHDHAYVAFARNDCDDCAPSVPLGVYYLTNKSGSWSTPKKLAGLSMDWPTIQVNGSHISVSWERCECIPKQTGQVWFGTNASGSWTKTKVAQNADSPSLALNSAGLPRIAFVQNGIRYAIGSTKLGNFSIAKVTGSTSHDSRPSLALSPSGLARVAWSRYGSAAVAGVYDSRRSATGSWTTRREDANEGPPAIATDDETTWQIGTAQLSNGVRVLLANAGGNTGVTTDGQALADKVDVDTRGGQTVWMYTVVDGTPAGIYYVHT